MRANFPSKAAIAMVLASAALVTACGQNEEVSQSEQETTSTASAASESITSPTVESITNPDTGATAQTGANTNLEYGTTSSGAGPAADMKAERSGPPAGETTGPHTTTDMLAVSPVPSGAKDSTATSDASQTSGGANETERTTPDANAGVTQESSGTSAAEEKPEGNATKQ